MLVAEKSGFTLTDTNGASDLKDFADRLTKQAMASMEEAPQPAKIGRN
jgi:hypothetical protein